MYLNSFCECLIKKTLVFIDILKHFITKKIHALAKAFVRKFQYFSN